MSESVFKTKQEPEREVVYEEKPTEYQQRELTNKDVVPEREIGELEVWEAEKQKKYINDIFDTHEIGHEFKWKMPLSQIDKYIREEMDERQYAKTTENYKSILAEIEAETNSDKMETWQRIQRIIGYIQAIKNLKKAKQRLALLRNSA